MRRQQVRHNGGARGVAKQLSLLFFCCLVVVSVAGGCIWDLWNFWKLCASSLTCHAIVQKFVVRCSCCSRYNVASVAWPECELEHKVCLEACASSVEQSRLVYRYSLSLPLSAFATAADWQLALPQQCCCCCSQPLLMLLFAVLI